MEPKTHYYQLLPADVTHLLLLFCHKGLTWILSLIPEFGNLIEKKMLPVWKTCVTRYAVKCDSIKLLEWARLQGCIVDQFCLYVAASRNNQEMCRYLYQQGCLVTDRVTGIAIKTNNVEILLWLEGIGHLEAELTPQVNPNYFAISTIPKVPSLVFSIEDSNLHTIRFLFSRFQSTTKIIRRCFEKAARRGSIEILEWLEAKYPAFSTPSFWVDDPLETAAEECNLEILKWIEKRTKVSKWPKNLCDMVLSCGKLRKDRHKNFKEVFLWLRSKGLVYTTEGIKHACFSYNIEGLELINLQNLCSWPEKNDLVKKLVKRGTNESLEIIVWLKKNKPDMLEGFDLCTLSVESNNLRLFEWARRNGYTGKREDGEKIVKSIKEKMKSYVKCKAEKDRAIKENMINRATKEAL
jgi:hypothetical protein